ncbi:MAG TPA: MltA domain-containing protein [Rhizobiaceae bacterium]|nr:MltA domain-containing protein [Rhizobiaceae bacterium]
MLVDANWRDLPGWNDDRLADALAAFQRSAAPFALKPYKQGSLGIEPGALGRLFEHALTIDPGDEPVARRFFETHFTPYRIADPHHEGLVTGYYEPVIAAARRRTAGHRTPFLRPPPNLVDLEKTGRPAGFPGDLNWGLLQRDGSITPCPDRSAIENGAFDGLGLEIAFVADPVDVFFAHVQGSARLEFEDGGALRIGFAGKSGHPFTGIGRLLVERGEVAADAISMKAIRAWLAAHPREGRALMRENRSYIFFREIASDGPGPVAAARAPLTPGRSMAVDRRFHTFGTPVFVSAEADLDRSGAPFRRLMIAQDTGSAILGAARGDLYMGTGNAAGELAGRIKAHARFFVLTPGAQAQGGGR